MKKQTKNQTPGKPNMFFKLLMVSLLTANSFSLLNAQETPSKPLAAEIKYIGTMGDKLVFQVDYENKHQENCSVEITDQNGYQFYHSTFKSKNFKKKFAIEKSDLEDNSIRFSIGAKGNEKREIFGLNTFSNIVEELRVVKL